MLAKAVTPRRGIYRCHRRRLHRHAPFRPRFLTQGTLMRQLLPDDHPQAVPLGRIGTSDGPTPILLRDGEIEDMFGIGTLMRNRVS